MLSPLLQNLFLGSLIVSLTACGGGGGGGDSGDNSGVGSPAALAGQFVDGPVSGIRYKTATQSGITGSNGQFEYLEGETVSLYIGAQLLGHAPGTETITLFDLVDGVEPLVGLELETTLTNLTGSRWEDGQFRPSFNTVINLARLLQTLDTDGDPGNGIEIAAGVAALFTADSVDFHQHWDDFTNELGFRKVLGDAKSQGLLDNARQVRKPWRAMTHLYASLGIDSKLRALRVISSVSPGGGVYDYVSTFEFDDEGKRTRWESDGDGDGIANEISSYTYDTNGNQTGYGYDYNADGTPESYRVFTYDSEGNLTRMELHNDEDDMPEVLETYTYGTYGNETRYEKYEKFRGLTAFGFTDYDASGRPVTIENTAGRFTWTYTRDGSEIFRDVLPGEFRRSSLSTWTYDANDNLLRKEYDYDRDGTLDVILLYTNDADGKRILYEEDDGANGSIERTQSTAYDAEGRLLREEWDYDNDGKPDRTQTYTYDARGSQTRYEDDTDGDGTPENVRAANFEYDSDGNVIRLEADGDGDGVFDSVTIYTYDARGNRVRQEIDFGGDGSTDTMTVYTYDANDILIRQVIDSDLDGTPDNIQSYEYDADINGWWQALGGLH
ncbi:MAG: RHS repeat protein [Halioglobus sp.]|nr:RHS repeat protein [Halioglobus sp.]